VDFSESISRRAQAARTALDPGVSMVFHNHAVTPQPGAAAYPRLVFIRSNKACVHFSRILLIVACGGKRVYGKRFSGSGSLSLFLRKNWLNLVLRWWVARNVTCRSDMRSAE